MAEISKFFNSAPGDERWHFASDFAEYFGNVLSSGLLHKDGVPNLQVRVVSGTMKTVVDVGEALIKGYQYGNTTPLELSHGLPETNLDRIDRIVLRLDKRNNARYIRAFVKEGVSAANPVPPTLQRDQYVFELSLAQIRITKNTASLDPAKLIDERMEEELCGIVHSLISVPTSVFQQQWDVWFNQQKALYDDDFTQWSDAKKAEFEAWLADINSLLVGDVAGNLLALINKNTSDIGDTTNLLTTNKTDLVNAVNELFTSADNAKKDYAGIIGAPAKLTDTFAVLNNLLKVDKNNLVTHLNAKQQPSVNTESLDSLIGKVAKINTGGPISPAKPGEIEILKSLSEFATQSVNYTKAKEFKMNVAGVIRVKFDIKSNGNGAAIGYSRIYVNGIARGVEMTVNLSNYTARTEDITVNKGDLVQIFINRASSYPYTTNIANCRIAISLDEYDFGTVNL